MFYSNIDVSMKTKLYTATCLFILFLLSLPMMVQAKAVHLLPKPKHLLVKTKEKAFRLQRDVVLDDATATPLLKTFLLESGCRVVEKAQAKVRVELVDSIPNMYDYVLYGYDNEAYSLQVSEQEIVIKAVKPIGVIRAAQTLQQLSEGYDKRKSIEAVEIVDYPAFKLRGFMHDVGRSYMEFDELKKQIYLFSRFKINTFHWHLTENQAWRFEVKGLPQLTDGRFATRHPGKYYTQKQCRELEEYARQYGVTVIPEIDMPGHSAAFERAMGYEMQTEEGVATLKNILTQLAQTFVHAPYLHIGADEKKITYPKFVQMMTDHVRGFGKKGVIWYPIQGDRTGADMAQLWSTAGRLQAGIPNIDCRYNYTNHFDLFADIVGIYKSSIYYSHRGNSELAGFVSAAWNDHLLSSDADIMKQNNVYAAVLASASRGWTGGGKQYIEQGGTILPNEGEEWEDFNDWEQRFLFHKAHSLKNEPIGYVRQSHARWNITQPLSHLDRRHLPYAHIPDVKALLEEVKKEKSQVVAGSGIYLRHTWGNIVPTVYDDKALNHTVYAWTYIYSPRRQEAGALIEFQNYSRSERDFAPPAGHWDYKGSQVWLNYEEIKAPDWVQHDVRVEHETVLLDANCTARKPIRVQLKKGWNVVLMKLPYIQTDKVRLNKWMFTFSLTDVDGKNALEGVRY